MTRSMALAALAVGLAGCGSTIIPLYDKAGATREEEFHARAACVKQQSALEFLPGRALTHCMEASGYTFLGNEIP